MSRALVSETNEKSLWHRANEYMLNSIDHLIRRTLAKLRESCSQMDLEDARFRKIFLAGIQSRYVIIISFNTSLLEVPPNSN